MDQSFGKADIGVLFVVVSRWWKVIDNLVRLSLFRFAKCRVQYKEGVQGKRCKAGHGQQSGGTSSGWLETSSITQSQHLFVGFLRYGLFDE